jgi:hypothetical protein
MFAETGAIPLFPTFMWTHQLGPDDTARMNNLVRTKLMSFLERKFPIEPGQKLQTQQDFHLLPECQELAKCILAAAEGVTEFMHVAEEGIEITSCWVNFHPKGAFNPPLPTQTIIWAGLLSRYARRSRIDHFRRPKVTAQNSLAESQPVHSRKHRPGNRRCKGRHAASFSGIAGPYGGPEPIGSASNQHQF